MALTAAGGRRIETSCSLASRHDLVERCLVRLERLSFRGEEGFYLFAVGQLPLKLTLPRRITDGTLVGCAPVLGTLDPIERILGRGQRRDAETAESEEKSLPRHGTPGPTRSPGPCSRGAKPKAKTAGSSWWTRTCPR